jgi:hypothetical protein
MSNEDVKLQTKSNERRFRHKFTWAVAAGVAGLIALGTHSTGSSAVDREQAIPLSPASDFSISKAEGRDGDEIYVTYTKKDCFLSGVNSAVSFHYKSGAEVTVVLFWPKWSNGETKTFRNTEFRQGPIQKVAFWGTAKENSVQGGKKNATRVTFSERKSF